MAGNLEALVVRVLQHRSLGQIERGEEPEAEPQVRVARTANPKLRSVPVARRTAHQDEVAQHEHQDGTDQARLIDNPRVRFARGVLAPDAPAAWICGPRNHQPSPFTPEKVHPANTRSRCRKRAPHYPPPATERVVAADSPERRRSGNPSAKTIMNMFVATAAARKKPGRK